MPNLFSRTELQQRIASAFSDPAILREKLGDTELPENLRTWLSRLKLLSGVPINYLVPNEGMLPPESIRFFYVDMNWVDALLDGAFSIGRNLTQSPTGAKMNLDRAIAPRMREQAAAGTAHLRASAFGVAPPAVTLQTVSGFLLRSSVVISCPGIGVYAYDANGGGLTLLRFEKLGPTSDTLICLVDGDIAKADLHEPPEGLHYGIDQYSVSSGVVTAMKKVHTFSPPNGNIKLNQTPQPEPIGTYFRTTDPRTVRVNSLAGFIGSLSGPFTLDSAQMGFEMTQGVGMVSFVKKAS